MMKTLQTAPVPGTLGRISKQDTGALPKQVSMPIPVEPPHPPPVPAQPPPVPKAPPTTLTESIPSLGISAGVSLTIADVHAARAACSTLAAQLADLNKHDKQKTSDHERVVQIMNDSMAVLQREKLSELDKITTIEKEIADLDKKLAVSRQIHKREKESMVAQVKVIRNTNTRLRLHVDQAMTALDVLNSVIGKPREPPKSPTASPAVLSPPPSQSPLPSPAK